ncbi:MAG: DUF3592 domain-containing protein [Myxococcota bacterium]|jgi:hypothetical protein|nr:DUF3592 domain-containing protein [Myxococcota bacterium]
MGKGGEVIKNHRTRGLWSALLASLLLAVLMLGLVISVADYRSDAESQRAFVCRVETARLVQQRSLLRLELELTRESKAIRLTPQSQELLVFSEPSEASSALHAYSPGSEHPCWSPGASPLLGVELRSPARRHFPLLLTLLVVTLLVAVIALRQLLSYLASRRRSQHALAHRLREPRSPLLALMVLMGGMGLSVLVCYGIWWTGGRALVHGLGQSRWEQREATILFTEVELGGEDNDEYELILLYSYEYQGKQYFSNSYRYLGSMPSSKEVVVELEKSLKKQPVHSVWVDPDDPRRAVLERSHPSLGLFALPFLSVLLLLYNPTQLSLISVYRWAFRQFRPRRSRSLPELEEAVDAELSPRSYGQRLREAAEGIEDRLALSAGGTVQLTAELRLSLDEWSLRVQVGDAEELHFDYERSSLHLSRSSGAADRLDDAGAAWLHVELRSGRTRLALSAQGVDSEGEALLEGLPCLHRAGQRCEWALLVKLVGLLLEREMELAPWMPSQGRAQARPKAVALRFDSAARARRWFVVYASMMPASLGFLAMAVLSVLQPYPNESRWLEAVLIPLLAFGVLSNVVFVYRNWRLWRGTRLRISTDHQPQLGQPLMLSAELGGAAASPVSVSLELWSEESETIPDGDDSKVERRRHWEQEVQLELSASQPEASQVVLVPSFEEGAFPPAAGTTQSLCWRLSAKSDVVEKGFELGEPLELDVAPAGREVSKRGGATTAVKTQALSVKTKSAELRIPESRDIWPVASRVSGELWIRSAKAARVRLASLYLLRRLGDETDRVYEVLRLQVREEAQRTFSFTLPEEALSFTGQHVQLRWYLELVLLPLDEVLRHELIIRPV